MLYDREIRSGKKKKRVARHGVAKALCVCVIFRLLLLLLPPLFFCCISTHGTCYSVYIVVALCLVSVAGWPAPLPTCTTHCWLVDVVKDNVAPSPIIAVLYLLGQMRRKGMNKKERRKNYVQNFQVLGKKKKKQNKIQQTRARGSLTGGTAHKSLDSIQRTKPKEIKFEGKNE